RALMMADSINTKDWLEPERHHWAQQDWRTVVVSETLPGLQEWTPGAELPQPTDCSHISPWPKRAAQRIVHAALLPLFDRSRPKWCEGTEPRRLPDETLQSLHADLAEEQRL